MTYNDNNANNINTNDNNNVDDNLHLGTTITDTEELIGISQNVSNNQNKKKKKKKKNKKRNPSQKIEADEIRETSSEAGSTGSSYVEDLHMYADEPDKSSEDGKKKKKKQKQGKDKDKNKNKNMKSTVKRKKKTAKDKDANKSKKKRTKGNEDEEYELPTDYRMSPQAKRSNKERSCKRGGRYKDTETIDNKEEDEEYEGKVDATIVMFLYVTLCLALFKYVDC